MSVPYIEIQKLGIGYMDFVTQPKSNSGLIQNTVKQLRVICKNHKIAQTGRKAEIIQRLSQATGAPKHPKGEKPYWFWWDEAVGSGAHRLFYVCRCGLGQPMDQFNVRKDGLIFPSIECGDEDCCWHIWGRLKSWKETKTLMGEGWDEEWYHPKYDYDPPLL